MTGPRGDSAAPSVACTGNLRCPVCYDPFRPVERGLRCERNHHFDFAREGYVNLLPAGHGRSRIEGDTAEMIRARQRFLTRGHYSTLAARIAALTQHHLIKVTSGYPAPAAVLEVGSGSGYYIGEVARQLQRPDLPRPVCFYGLDVSKDAARLAARAHRNVLFFVNDLRHRITLGDASMDVILDIFAPRNPQEFARVAAPGGLLVIVIPLPQHLQELREQLPMLAVEAGKRERTLAGLAGDFELTGEERVEEEMQFDGAEIVDALRMTPSAWHLTEGDLARAADMPRQTVTAGFEILQFQRQLQPLSS